MEDYKEQMIELFSRYYSPIGEEYQKKYYSTFAVYMMFKTLIPSVGNFDEHSAYEILKELGYQQELNFLTKEVILVEESDEMDEEKDTEIVSKVFCWVVFEKDL